MKRKYQQKMKETYIIEKKNSKGIRKAQIN